MEKASDDYEKEIYRKIRDMPVPYEKLDEILKDSRDIIDCSVCHVFIMEKQRG